MRKLIAIYLTTAVTLSLLFQPSFVIGTETPLRESPMMPPSTPPSTSSTPPTTSTTSPSAVDTAIKAGVHVSVDDRGYLVFSANPSTGVKITAKTIEQLEVEKKTYEIGFFYGYVEGFKHFQKGGTFNFLVASPLIPKSDNPISDMGEFQGRMAGWRAAKLAQDINTKTK